jgi:membrane protease YdiL (CAAX protease family)
MIVADWIRRHQIVAFFLITFAITWGLGFSFDAVVNRGSVLLAPLAFVALCGPALAGIIVTAVRDTRTREESRKAFWIAFSVAWIVSTLVFLANNTFINQASLSTGMVAFTLVSVVPVAFVISMAYSRVPAVRAFVSSLIRPHGVWGWALLALVLIPGLVLLSVPIGSLLGQQSHMGFQLPPTGLALIGLVTVKFLYQLLFFNATGEEVGWRGFALPRIQSVTSPLVACGVIHLFWPLWHVFLWMAEGRPVSSPMYWAQTYLELLPATVTIGWLYNRSKGSILVAGITHAAANTAFAFFPSLYGTVFVGASAVAALVMVVVDRMWRKLPLDHPAVYRVPASDG